MNLVNTALTQAFATDKQLYMKNIEIERKFLVKGDFKASATKSYDIAQGYLSTDPERNVRVRIKGQKAYITIKGLGNLSGMSRFEWEKEISVEDASSLLQLCKPYPIEKTRYEVIYQGKTFEVDVFRGENDGLILAELELESESDVFEKPEWLGEEVTGEIGYYNSYLSEHPYKKPDWKTSQI